MSTSSITVTGLAQRAAWQEKTLPPVEHIRHDVWSIPVPFPNPMRYTLSYLIIDHDEALVIDPGWDSDEGLDHLRAGLRRAGLGIPDLTGVIATHYHSDHLGLANRLRRESGAWVALGERETIRVAGTDPGTDRLWMTRWGVPPERMDEVAFSGESLANLRGLAEPDLRLADGQLLPASGLRVVLTPGHSPGHTCFIDKDRGIIFSGDHVLPRISPHIAFESPGPANPLADYYRSLSHPGFDDEMEVCPAHEYRFIGMQRRMSELLDHNHARAAEVLRVLDERDPQTLWDIARQLTWSRGWDSIQGMSLRAALSETASHLVDLSARGHEISIAAEGNIDMAGARTLG